jgi:hypothetical protein
MISAATDSLATWPVFSAAPPDRTQIQQNEPFFSENSGPCAGARANIRKISECQGGLSGRPLTHHGMNQANIFMPKWLGTAG